MVREEDSTLILKNDIPIKIGYGNDIEINSLSPVLDFIKEFRYMKILLPGHALKEGGLGRG
jgi:hypothetical protein